MLAGESGIFDIHWVNSRVTDMNFAGETDGPRVNDRVNVNFGWGWV
jgi:hypothetical protein